MTGPTRTNSTFLQPAFVICVAVLTMAVASMSIATRTLGVYLEKEPLPLQKSFDLLDESALAPYRVVSKQTIDNTEVIESLGTTDYIQWVLEDPNEPEASPVRRMLLFVTYYPTPDRVPHVPEECYTGSGYPRLETEDVRLLTGPGSQTRSIPARYLLFGSSGREAFLMAGRFPVLYFFRVNGRYEGKRDDARAALNQNIFGRHSYFSKVELAFNQALTGPTREQAIAATERLLSVVLPILEREHWPSAGTED
ncbi:MAG: hypothetical protein JW993_13505 [Sedimentisphaerales bacterium]|nr:hypothetical protein [Sedimentisphaerales bacterium]